MAKQNISTRAQNFPKWYQDVIGMAPDLYDESPVTGCITFGPLATALWSNIRKYLDKRMRAMGVENIMLPLLIPQSFFDREKEHVEGFAPECAIVTEAGGAKLPERYAVRPTSETLFVDWYSRGGRVQSHRDLPLLVNQWCSVMRWEKRPRAFLRTSEFHWQEGHCIFASQEQCRAFTLAILDLYAELSEKILAVPVVKGDKPPHEVFPGAIGTYTIEGMMQDGKALQMGTSHMLSQNFLKGSDGKPLVSFLDKDEKQQVPWYDSWGASTRLLGAMFMAHGDDDGIVLPPAIAPVHAAVLPIYAGTDDALVEAAARQVMLGIAGSANPFGIGGGDTKSYKLHGREQQFEQAEGGLTVRMDNRRELRLGDKTFRQIHAGTPVRVEIGARDLAENSCVVKSRIRGRDGAVKTSLSNAPEVIAKMLKEDQQSLYDRSLKMQKEKTVEAKNYDELKAALEEGKWAMVAWDGTPETVAKLKADTQGGSYRCFPFDAEKNAKGQKDPVSGKDSAFAKKIIVGKAY